MISFVKLLLLPQADWEKAREKSKPPKSKLEGILYDILISTLEKRLAEYPTTIEVTIVHSLFSETNRTILDG